MRRKLRLKRKTKKFMTLFSMITIFVLGIFAVKAAGNLEPTKITVKDQSSTITVADPVLTKGEVTSNIIFNEKGDYVLFDVILKNNKNNEYVIKKVTDNNTNDNIKIEYDYSKKIGVGGTGSLKIKMSYQDEVDEDQRLTNLVITIEGEDGSKDEIVVNPDTKDNVIKYLLLLIISIVGIRFILRHKKGSKALLIVVISLLMVPAVVMASETITIKFTNIEIKKPVTKYTIVINPGDGSDPIVKEVKNGDKIGRLPEVEKEGYTFVRWKDQDGNTVTEDTEITGPIELEPEFTPNQYHINFDPNGGRGETSAQEMTYDQPANISDSTFTPSGDREFVEWNTKPDGSGDSYPARTEVENLSTGDDITLYAQWRTVTNLQDGYSINEKMRTMSDEDAFDDGEDDEVVVGIYRTTSLPDGFTPSDDNTISVSGAEFPTYIYLDNDTGKMYWYTEAEKIYLNPNSGWIFDGYALVTEIPFLAELDTSRVTNMQAMFAYTRAFTDISGVTNWDTSKVTNMSYLFMRSGLESLEPLTNWDVSNVETMASMFEYSGNFPSTVPLAKWNTSKTKNMQRMFSSNISLSDLSGLADWNTSKVTNMQTMFYRCNIDDVSSLAGWDVSRVTSMGYMFEDCSGITSLDALENWNVQNVSNMSSMFKNLSNLESVDFMNSWDLRNVYYMSSLFENCSKASGTMRIMRQLYEGPGTSGYNNMFKNAATAEGTQINVNYTTDVAGKIDTYVATKSANSNVVKGIQITS